MLPITMTTLSPTIINYECHPSKVDIEEDASLRSSPTAPTQRLPAIANDSHMPNRISSSDADLFDETPSIRTPRTSRLGR